MNTSVLRKRQLTLKKQTFTKMLRLLISLGYGFFIVGSLLLQYFLGSGDINAYIHFFDEAGNDASVLTLQGDYAFRIAVFGLTEYFQQTTITILCYMAFIISSITMSFNFFLLSFFSQLIPIS